MATTAKIYTNAFAKVFAKEIDWINSPVKAMLLANTYVPDQNAHDYVNDVIAHEVSGPNYVARGKALSGKTVEVADKVVYLKSDDVSWANTSMSVRFVVLYVDTGVDNTSTLIGYMDFGVDQTTLTSEFLLAFDQNRVCSLPVA